MEELNTFEGQINNKGCDSVLAAFVGMANTTGLSFVITMSIKGLVITGTVISGREFFDGPHPDTHELLNRALKIFGQTLYPTLEEDNQPNEDAPTDTIHLKDVTILPSNQSQPTNHLKFWRGKISAVDGWYVAS